MHYAVDVVISHNILHIFAYVLNCSQSQINQLAKNGFNFCDRCSLCAGVTGVNQGIERTWPFEGDLFGGGKTFR